jgi:hypothetical protein
MTKEEKYELYKELKGKMLRSFGIVDYKFLDACIKFKVIPDSKWHTREPATLIIGSNS